MKSLPVVALVLSVVAVAASLWPRDAAPAPPPSLPAQQTSSADVAHLERRIVALEESTNDLWVRVAHPRSGPVASADAGAAASPEVALEVARLREEVRGMVVGETMNSESGRTVFREAVRSVQEELQVEQRAVRQQQRAEAQTVRAQESKARWKQFATDAKLTWAQEQQLTQRLDVEEKTRAALMAEVEAGTKSFRDVRQGVQAERRATDDAIKTQLSEEQQQAYDAVLREDSGGRGGGGFGPGGGGRGGGQRGGGQRPTGP